MKKKSFLILGITACLLFNGCGNTAKNVEENQVSDAVAEMTDVSQNEEQALSKNEAKEKQKISDFYDFVNGEWIANTTIPENKVELIYDNYNLDKIGERLGEMVINPPKSFEAPEMQKLLAFYEQLKDADLRENESMADIKAVLDRIESAKKLDDIYKIMLDEELSLFNRIFNLSYEYSNGGEYLLRYSPAPIKDIYYALSEEEKNILYEGYTSELGLLGFDEDTAKTIITNAFKMNDVITDYWNSNTDGSLHYYQVDEINERKSKIPYEKLIRELGFEKENYKHEDETGMWANDAMLSFYEAVFTEEALPYIRDFYVLSALDKLADVGSDKLSNINYSMIMHIQGAPLEYDFMDEDYSPFGTIFLFDKGIIGHFYSEEMITDEQKQEMLELINNLKDEMVNLVKAQDWLSVKAKEKLSIKIKQINVLMGSFDEWNHLEDFEIQDTPAKTAIALMKSNREYEKRHLKREGGIVSNDAGLFEKNAWYYRNENTIVVNISFFEGWEKLSDMPFEEVMGKYGETIAHEMGHALDSRAIYLLNDGTEGDFLSDEEFDHLWTHYDKIAAFYDGMETDSGSTINGYSITAETLADLMAMQCCLQYMEKMDNVDYNLFFETLAKDNARLSRPEREEFLSKTDGHLPAKERTNYWLLMFDKFYEVYEVSKESKYYVPEEDRFLGLE